MLNEELFMKRGRESGKWTKVYANSEKKFITSLGITRAGE